jgi:carbon-monoxide dehydrogenase small subunit
MINKISFQLNGRDVEIVAHPLKRLLDVLREDCGLTGTKEGCGEGECGACSVLINGELVNACLYPIAMAENQEILTIEGFRETERFKLLKACFEEAGAVQCGFCSPGMIMAAEALLRKQPHPTMEMVKEGISGNLCRCTGYNMIIEAVMSASQRGDGLW